MLWFLRLFPSFRRLMDRIEALETANAERNLPRVMAPVESALGPAGATRQDRRRINAMADTAQYQAQLQASGTTGWGEQ